MNEIVPAEIMGNVSVLFFTLSGLNYTVQHRIILFGITLLFYSIIWIVNAVVILIIIVDQKLHEAMYIFLCSLCINGLYGTTAFYPKFLNDLLSPFHFVSYAGCVLQSFVIYSSCITELSILAVMALDRYVAICQPLEYHSVMTRRRISLLVAFSWLFPFYCMLVNTLAIIQLKLCGSHIPKIYCSNALIDKLACSKSIANTAIVYVNICLYVFHLLFLLWTYTYLVKTCQISKHGRKKFMNTCVPHLVSLISYSCALLFDVMYTRYGSNMISESLKNFMAIEYLILPPIINPLVYGIKMTKILNRVLGFFHGQKEND